MTYRLDSTIPIPYGQVLHRPVREQPDLKQILVKKTKLIAWVVSNCVTESQRRKYVQLLQTHLREPVDIYGGCGGNYSHCYPKKSFLDTNDFTTTKELAEYIHCLDRNDTAYLEYLSNKVYIR
ncbi:3-galactosyl-N-acetylglucosaminide 4-alpha-L-fucosyltransferase FUT3-like [Patella vulgata]|uniref:3-galactosyl-N-acetylglucosaminide 4-alpha-L-fucosyltransferase FUT3-like n=1 Tax=Patella vulgata TaxID=6465 RepID=UPI00217F28CB|nr:3-galactosyl-N-acetylglucosaminide 4-alpha-L-fucosyltransferase FUT3-like [Patella vulgata]